MKKFLRIILIVIITLLCSVGAYFLLWAYPESSGVKGRLDSRSETVLGEIDSALTDYNLKYHQLPSNLWDLYNKNFVKKNFLYDLRSENINVFNYYRPDFTLAPLLYDSALKFSKTHPEGTIIVAQPVSVYGFRYVLLWHDFKPKRYFEHYKFVKRISEAKFQEQIKKQKWDIEKSRKEDGKIFSGQTRKSVYSQLAKYTVLSKN